MAEHARREMLHVFRNDVVAAAEQRVGLRRMDQRDGRARACAKTEQRRVSRGGADGGDVCAHLLGAVNRLDRLRMAITSSDEQTGTTDSIGFCSPQ